MNPFDLFALEMAAQLKSQYSGSITALTMGLRSAGRFCGKRWPWGQIGGIVVRLPVCSQRHPGDQLCPGDGVRKIAGLT